VNRCLHCGRANRPGAAFCQDCGKPITAATPEPSRVRPPTPVAGVPIGATCHTCRTVNPPGMQFCKMCGTQLMSAAQPSVPARAPTPGPSVGSSGAGATQVFACQSCSKPTPAGFVFCQNCGARLEAPSPAPPVIPVPVGGATPLAVPPVVLSTLPGAMPARVSSSGNGSVASGSGPQPRPVTNDPMAVTFRVDTPPGSTPAPAPVAAATWGALVRVQIDGRDGQRLALAEREVSLGRDQGVLTFPDDRYLAGLHAVIERHAQGARVRVLDQVNGVLVRLREPHQLIEGDVFLAGQQLFRYEPCAASEREPAPLSQHGVSLFGTPSRPAWGRLRQLTTSGHTRDVLHLTRPEIVLGREDGDHRFPDDDFMSRRHVALTSAQGRAQLADLGSSNGTYLRVRGEQLVRPGDTFRLGDQVLRFEPS
jgi:hypothetical protein